VDLPQKDTRRRDNLSSKTVKKVTPKLASMPKPIPKFKPTVNRGATKQMLISTNMASTKEKDETREIKNTVDRLVDHEDLDHNSWEWKHRKYVGVAKNLKGKNYLSPFEYIDIPPIQTTVDGGVVTVRYSTTLHAGTGGGLTVSFGQNFDTNGEVTGNDLIGSPFPYDSSTGNCQWFTYTWQGTPAVVGPVVTDLADGCQNAALSRADLLAELQEFGSAIRFLGAAMTLTPIGPQGTRQGLLWASKTGQGGWGAVPDSTGSLFLTQERVQNKVNYVQGAVATDYVYTTLWPDRVEDMEFKPIDYILNADPEDTKRNSIGTIACGVLGGVAADEYMLDFIVHYQLAPSRSTFQLVKSVATKSNSVVVDEMFNAFKTHCCNHIFPAGDQFNTFVSTVSHEDTALRSMPCFMACKKGKVIGGFCVHEKTSETHKLNSEIGRWVLSTHSVNARSQLAKPVLMTGKSVVSSIGKGIETFANVSRPLLEIASVLADLF
jgi:hypothetical protein